MKLSNLSHIPRFCCKLLFVALLAIPQTFAQHLDIEVWGQGNALFAGYCRTTAAVGCDLDGLADALGLPDGTLPPIEAATDKRILGFLKFQRFLSTENYSGLR